MKLKLTEKEKEHLLQRIEIVLKTGEQWEDKLLHHPAGAIIDAILEIKGVEKDVSSEDKAQGFDQNGWQWDWWQDFTFDGKRYTLSGSGFYGGHAFHLSDEQ